VRRRQGKLAAVDPLTVEVEAEAEAEGGAGSGGATQPSLKRKAAGEGNHPTHLW
jgi:hypothetical protein